MCEKKANTEELHGMIYSISHQWKLEDFFFFFFQRLLIIKFTDLKLGEKWTKMLEVRNVLSPHQP